MNNSQRVWSFRQVYDSILAAGAQNVGAHIHIVMLVVPLEHFFHGFILDTTSAWLAHDCEWLSVELKHAHVSLELLFSDTLVHVRLKICVQRNKKASSQELGKCYCAVPPDVEKCGRFVAKVDDSGCEPG